ncbi:hypothetical protein L3073_17525 [Ancylomarina sp. DW003]|nr:hypothetical protein [Ancylomarina sp. DW003]MDE5424019.1 hypothetical protein [Ancylomarina sp. DW003]
MAYNRKNFLEKVIYVQEYYSAQNKKGIPNTRIVQNLKELNIYISLATFYNYLATPAKREIKEIEERERLKKQHG